MCFDNHYLGGKEQIDDLFQIVRALKCNDLFYHLFIRPESQEQLVEFAGRLSKIIASEEKFLSDDMGFLGPDEVETLSGRIDDLKDINGVSVSMKVYILRRFEITNLSA